MGSNFHQWELDPLFSAAEVVQDSADRMDPVYRLLLHEQSLVQGDRQNKKLRTSIEFHVRDLATKLETTKWQLEDFERAVNLSTKTESSQIREDIISRHKQFILAIRDQIIHVEKTLEDPSTRDSIKNTDWVNLNERDRDGLALFLTGGNPVGHLTRYEHEDGSIMRRFLDPTTAVSSVKTDEIVEHKNQEIENKVSTRMGPKFCRDGMWDLEADRDERKAKGKSLYDKNRLRGYDRRAVFGFFGNLWSKYGTRVTGSFTKRWKDGEEPMPSSSYVGVLRDMKCRHTHTWSVSGVEGLWSQLSTKLMRSCSWLGGQYQRLTYRFQVNQNSVRLLSAVLFILLLLGILVSHAS